MRLAIRVFVDGIRQSEDRLELELDALDTLMPDLASKHAAMMATRRGMVEIEFLDELNPDQRFFRIGTDPAGTVLPPAVDLDRPTDILSKWGKKPS